jgi:glyoxylase-like metal-dependent hydrolase (beta-lactamase superfamily II)
MNIEEDIPFFPSSGYDSNTVLIGSDTIIDTGTGMNIQQLWKWLESQNVKPESIKTIINTHCHADHIGGNRYFKASVLAHERDADAIATADKQKILGLDFPIKFELCKVRALKDKEILKLGDHTFTVLHTPGHTEGSMCLYESDSKILISGDTVFADGGLGRVDLPTGSATDMVASLEKLASLEVEKLLPGHGPPVLSEAKKHVQSSLFNAKQGLP